MATVIYAIQACKECVIALVEEATTWLFDI